MLMSSFRLRTRLMQVATERAQARSPSSNAIELPGGLREPRSVEGPLGIGYSLTFVGESLQAGSGSFGDFPPPLRMPAERSRPFRPSGLPAFRPYVCLHRNDGVFVLAFCSLLGVVVTIKTSMELARTILGVGLPDGYSKGAVGESFRHTQRSAAHF